MNESLSLPMGKKNSIQIFDFLRRNGAWVGFFSIAILGAVLTHGAFLSARNLTHLLRQASINGILATGMTFVILSGGIDLSVGSVVALCGIIVGLSQTHWGLSSLGFSGALISLLLAIFSGAFFGLINGSFISFLRIPPFVITLGSMVIARGVALILSDGSAISPMGDSVTAIAEIYLSFELTLGLGAVLLFGLIFRNKRRISDGLFPILAFSVFIAAFLVYKGFPVLVLFWVVVLCLADFLLMQTTFGRAVTATGSNEQAAFWAGISTRIVKVWVYGLMGALSGLGSLLLSARLNSAAPTAGNLFELDAIAAAVIGGTSLKGGVGTVLGTLAGALTISAVNNGMDLLEVPSFYQMVLKGVIIIVAVALDRGQKEGV